MGVEAETGMDKTPPAGLMLWLCQQTFRLNLDRVDLRRSSGSIESRWKYWQRLDRSGGCLRNGQGSRVWDDTIFMSAASSIVTDDIGLRRSEINVVNWCWDGSIQNGS